MALDLEVPLPGSRNPSRVSSGKEIALRIGVKRDFQTHSVSSIKLEWEDQRENLGLQQHSQQSGLAECTEVFSLLLSFPSLGHICYLLLASRKLTMMGERTRAR